MAAAAHRRARARDGAPDDRRLHRRRRPPSGSASTSRVVAEDRLVDEARAWAERLAAGPSFALEVTKKMLYREAAMDLDAALEAEVEIQAICMQDPNFREAYEAFRERRKPEFR